jgi:16S rRNA processing protein RimM
LCSKSSSEPEGMIPLGRVKGHRGLSGELTVTVAAGDATVWSQIQRVWIGNSSGQGDYHDVEERRAYGDKLVLKLAGIDDATSSAALKGWAAMAPDSELPALMEGEFFGAQLSGFEVVEESGEVLGHVDDIFPTGGVDLLIVTRKILEPKGVEELMIPLAKEIILGIDQACSRITVRLPEGLRSLNQPLSSIPTKSRE